MKVAITDQGSVLQGLNLKEGIHWERQLSPTEDPYETVEFELDDIELKNAKTGEVFHRDLGVLFPKAWSANARQIVSQHYLRGPLDSEEREKSVAQMVDRVVDWVVEKAMNGRPEANLSLPNGSSLFDSWDSAYAFGADLKYLIVDQDANFNSPVWYNIGVQGERQQPSACFILNVEDKMEAILNWYVEEGMIFKYGSGAGTNLTQLRSSFEGLSQGGWASGPVPYMCGADASAGSLKSGGRNRRAAKMVVLGIDHPDIFELATGAPGFIQIKARAEDVNQTLMDNGYDMSVDSGKDAYHVQFQNANNSVRVSNEFMDALLADGEWETVARRPDRVRKAVPKYSAQFLWNEIAKASHRCADPGLQMDTTVNFWHTTPAAGRINASNPCSEYMHLDNSPCNLAATNLLKFVGPDGGWDVERHAVAIEVVAIAQTVMAVFGDYPTKKIGEVAAGFRQIGQGYTNLGALLMSKGLGYDSEEGRSWAAAITSFMEASIYRASAKMAARWGAYPGNGVAQPGFDHPENRKAHFKVATLRREYSKVIAKSPSSRARRMSIKFGSEAHIDIFHGEVVGAGAPAKRDQHLRSLVNESVAIWTEAIELGEQFGWANAHMSVLAPMGTNGFMMDQDTSGIEPVLGHVVDKKKVDGSHMKLVNGSVSQGVVSLGYTPEQVEEISAYVLEKNSIVGAPHLRAEHYSVFDTSFSDPVGGRYLAPSGHVLMMAAVQPFLSGAISKTVNLPESVTVEDVERIHFESWRQGLKAVAIYRNNSKATQPMSTAGQQAQAGPPQTRRHKLPRKALGGRIKLRIVDPGMGEFEMYVLYSVYPDGSFGEIFEVAGAEGSLVNGLLAWGAKLLSGGAQHGMPMKDVVKLGLNMSFPPASNLIPPADSDFTSCKSIIDLLCRELALQFLSTEERHSLGIFTRQERADDVANTHVEDPSESAGESEGALQVVAPSLQTPFVLSQAPICFKCSIPMEPRGVCFVCSSCGHTTGCS